MGNNNNDNNNCSPVGLFIGSGLAQQMIYVATCYCYPMNL